MAEASLALQIVNVGGFVIAGASFVWTLRRDRVAVADKLTAHNKEVELAIAAVGKLAAENLEAHKKENEAAFKDVARVTADFMPKSDIVSQFRDVRDSMDTFQLQLTDTRLEVRENQARIADMSSDIAEVKAEVKDMRREQNEGFQRMNDSINQIVRSVK